jgi:predicted nucleotidyltransferase
MLKAYNMMTLIDIVSSKRKAEVLRLLFGLEPKEFYLRDLVRQSRLALRTVQLELVRLVKAGLVTSRRDGNRVYYQANRNNPLYPDLRNIVLKTAGLANVLREALRGGDIDFAFVFGSIAAEAARPESDVDLMVIGPLGLRQLAQRISRVAMEIGREINPHVMTREDFAARRRSGDHFVTSLLASPRLFIIGTENELAELGK